LIQFEISYAANSASGEFGEKKVKVKYKGGGKFESVTTGEVHEEVLDILSKFENELQSDSVYYITWHEL
jgi:hypothetical protein